MDLINNILKLAEMQYRKGFEAGYEASINGSFSLAEVKRWRFEGFKSGFTDKRCLNGAIYKNSLGSLVAELKNCKLLELAELLSIPENKTKIKVTEITETFDGIQLTITGIENLSDETIINKIKDAFKYV
jgi:hypothetical protein